MKTVELGKTYRDRITGFIGVCTGEAKYISGCDQVLLAPKTAKDGSHRDGCWFDIQRLDEVKVKQIHLDNGKTDGCDQPAPIR